MLKHTLAAISLVALAVSPALAQSTPPATPQTNLGTSGNPAHQSATNMLFLDTQSASEWRSSKLIGTKVISTNNQSIGEIEDVLIDNSGMIKGVVIGVGGFLGMGEKNVAIPFTALNLSRKVGSNDVGRITVDYTKEQLTQAPTFKYFSARDNNTTTGQSSNSNSTTMPKR